MAERLDRATSGAVDAPVGPCGLFCGACSAFIATRDDPERLAAVASRIGWSVEETACDGCRSSRTSKYCRTCRLVVCAAERGFEFCGECPEFPCADLQAFGRERPHRAEILQDLKRIREIGHDAWVVESIARNSCPDCGAINSAYDLRCRICGHDPGSAYAADHSVEIKQALSRAPVDK
jgi:hypothetical protein